MILETICNRGHMEHVAPSVSKPAEGIYIWGSAADYCQRWLNVPGGACEEKIVASWYLPGDGTRVQATGAPGATLRVDKTEEAQVTGERAPMLSLIDDVVAMIKEQGITLTQEQREQMGSLASKAGVYSHVVDLLTAEPEAEIEDEEVEHREYEDEIQRLYGARPSVIERGRTWLEQQVTGWRVGIVAVMVALSMAATVAAWLSGHTWLALLF